MVYPKITTRKVLIAARSAHAAHFAAIAQYAQESDWHLVPDMTATGMFPRGWTGDGILALVRHQPDLMAELRNSGIPCVVVGEADAVDLPCVVEDHEQIGRMAADHFLNRAHSRFAWAPLADDRANRQQLAGFQARLAEYGRPVHSLPEPHQWNGTGWQCDWSAYRRRLVDELERLPRPTAILAFNDGVAANLIDACREHGFSVPEEFAVLGVGNDPLVGASVPIPLSSIEVDHAQMAYQAAALLGRMMNGEAVPRQNLVSPKEVITRVSTDVTAVADPRIARALAFITENFSNPMLSVLDVACAVGVSRRNLERGFRQVTGCTIREQIVRTRMQEASRLLMNHPRTKIADIAELVGFAGTANFFRTFRQFYGVSPHAHRERTMPRTEATRFSPFPAAYSPVPAVAAG